MSTAPSLTASPCRNEDTVTTQQIILLIAVCLVLLLAFIWLFGCIKLFRMAFLRRKKQGRNGSDYTLDEVYGERITAGIRYADTLAHEEVSILSHDGLHLRASLYDTPNATATVILFHGYRSYGENDFGCVLSYYVEERGLRVLLVDQRAHGRSEGKYITFGILERYDCLAWANYVSERFGCDNRIILDGLSMGSSTVMMASDLDLPDNVKAIIADCGYTSPDAILRKVGADIRVPVGLFLGGVYGLCRLLAHFDPRATDAPRALAASHLPVLMVHGTGDDFVPCKMSCENARAGGDRVHLVLIEGAGHGLSYLVDPETVTKELSAFLDRYA